MHVLICEPLEDSKEQGVWLGLGLVERMDSMVKVGVTRKGSELAALRLQHKEMSYHNKAHNGR